MTASQHQHRLWQLASRLQRWISPHQYFYHRGKKYVVRGSGRRLISLLDDFVRINQHADESLLSLRGAISAVLASPSPVLLCYLLDRFGGDPKILRLMIWIIGKSHSHYPTKTVFARYEHPDPAVRREVVRTLRRLSAWRELRIISEKCRFQDTRELALEKKRPAFDQRLARFKRLIRTQPFEDHPQEVVVAANLELNGWPPRSGSQIRRILKSIRLLINRARSRRRLLFCRRLWRA